MPDAVTRHQLDLLADKIRRSMASDPENFTEREVWWMERDALNRKLKGTR